MNDFPALPVSKPLWLMTLADLALLLVGFLVLVQATTLDKKALSDGLRDGFGVKQSDPMPVAASAVTGFANGSAVLPNAPGELILWARDVAKDPRVTLRVTGFVDGSAADVDATTRSGAILAADRARTVAAALSGVVAPDRVLIVNNQTAGSRQVVVTLGFAGETPKEAP